MELRVESADGFSVPPGCFVGVRVGDVLKQGRYEPQRCYHFPAMERRRNAKIDIYRHVGSCVVAVDPEAKSLHEVNVASSDASVADMKLKVSVQSTVADSGKQREARTKAVKNQAKDYLSKYQIEEKLSEAVKALLKEQPNNPTDFLCRHLMSDGMSLGETASAMTSPKAAPVAKKAAPVALSPFNQYYAGHMRSCSPSYFSSLYNQFPAKKTASAPAQSEPNQMDMMKLRQQARDVLVSASQNGGLSSALGDVRPANKAESTKAAPPIVNKGFTLRPSVGTWLTPVPPKPQKVQDWNKLPSVGTWLAPAPEIEPQKEPPKCMMASNMMVGPQFYSLGLPNMIRVI